MIYDDLRLYSAFLRPTEATKHHEYCAWTFAQHQAYLRALGPFRSGKHLGKEL